MIIRAMTLQDHGQLTQLLKETAGVALREADSEEAFSRYLHRNPGLSFVVEDEARQIVGCVMCGHDGRRGYLQHLVVRPEHRGKELGTRLYQRCIDKLATIGIEKTHIFVFRNNDNANLFWSGKGWQRRDDICVYSLNISDNPNA